MYGRVATCQLAQCQPAPQLLPCSSISEASASRDWQLSLLLATLEAPKGLAVAEPVKLRASSVWETFTAC